MTGGASCALMTAPYLYPLRSRGEMDLMAPSEGVVAGSIPAGTATVSTSFYSPNIFPPKRNHP